MSMHVHHACADPRLATGLVAGLAVLALARLHQQRPRRRRRQHSAAAPPQAGRLERRGRREGRHRLLRAGRRPRLDGGDHQDAKAEAEKYADVELKVAEGTNDVNLQISQVETFINDKVDAIVLLPFDGAAMTPSP